MSSSTGGFAADVVIVGGCGRVGLPLGLAFASRGLKVVLHDINQAAVDLVNGGRMPYHEDGADEVLSSVVGTLLTASTDKASVGTAEHVVVVIGTPVDEHLNPEPHVVVGAVEALVPSLKPGQLIVLRSTLYPGVTRMVSNRVRKLGVEVDVCFCPERIAEGKAMTELFELPQIVSADDPAALDRAAKLFSNLTEQVVPLEPEEAELAKLFTNVWRYTKFAMANQLYMIANDYGLDYERIRGALAQDYPRAKDLPRAGFAAGPCLFKDTMQLAAFNNNNFGLGHASMLVNEGLPLYVVQRIEETHDLADKTVGILGMAFKAGSDDPRSSLSYKLKRILTFKAGKVLTTDPHVKTDGSLVPLEQVLAEADVLIVGTPHDEYADLAESGRTTAEIYDIWGIAGQGVRT